MLPSLAALDASEVAAPPRTLSDIDERFVTLAYTVSVSLERLVRPNQLQILIRTTLEPKKSVAGAEDQANNIYDFLATSCVNTMLQTERTFFETDGRSYFGGNEDLQIRYQPPADRSSTRRVHHFTTVTGSLPASDPDAESMRAPAVLKRLASSISDRMYDLFRSQTEAPVVEKHAPVLKNVSQAVDDYTNTPRRDFLIQFAIDRGENFEKSMSSARAEDPRTKRPNLLFVRGSAAGLT